MQCAQDGRYVFAFSDSRQDTGSTVLDVLQLLDVLARNPEKDSVKIKALDQLFCICCVTYAPQHENRVRPTSLFAHFS